MTSAAFTISGTAVPQATGLPVTTTYGATVALAVTSVVGAVSIDWAIVGVSAPSVATPTITRAGTPLGATATFTVCADPGTGSGVCYGVRCRVTDGAGQVFESHGLVGVAATVGFIPFVAGESGTWAHSTMGWTPRMNALITALAGVVGPTGATGSSGPTGATGPAGAQGAQGDPGYAGTVSLTSVPALYVGAAATVSATVTNATVWHLGLHGYHIDMGVGTGSAQNIVFTPVADHAGSGNITILGEGNGDYESAYVYQRDEMSILGSGSASSAAETGDDYTVAYTCHAGTSRKLLIWFGSRAAAETPTIGGISYNGHAGTLIATVTAADTFSRLWLYYVDDADMPASGAANIVVDQTSTTTVRHLKIAELDVAKQGAPDAYATANSLSVSVTAAVPDTYLVGGCQTTAAGAYAPASGQAELQDADTGDSLGGAIGWEAVAAGAQGANWTGTATNACNIAVAVAPLWY